MSGAVYLRSGTERWTVVFYKPCNTKLCVKTLKFWLSFKQKI